MGRSIGAGQLPMSRGRHGSKVSGTSGTGHPIMYGKPALAEHFDVFPDGGGYPLGFLEWVYKVTSCEDPAKVLHLCSGSVTTGVRIDIRPETKPDIVADCRAVPIEDESFDLILADPPYSQNYAENLYGTGDSYPTPFQLCKEASRLLRPGGKFGLLHQHVPMIRRPLKFGAVYGVTTGMGYRIRAWTLLTKISPLTGGNK